MSYTRPLGADGGTVLMACSICGVSYRYPGELRYCSDRLFRCLRTCDDPHIPQEEDKLNGVSLKTPDVSSPKFKLGTRPAWYTLNPSALTLISTLSTGVAGGVYAFFYQPATLSQKGVFSDAGGTERIAQPLVLNGSGQGTAYTLDTLRLVVKDAALATISDTTVTI